MFSQQFSPGFHILRMIAGLAILGLGISKASAQEVPPPLPADPNAAYAPDPAAPAPADPNAEVLTRGPVHEAYAAPQSSGQTVGVIVPRQPANPIEEVPPDMKPDSPNATWIPGYWSYDDERRDFVWVSGVWRVPAVRESLDAWLLAGGARPRLISTGFRLLDARASTRHDLPSSTATKH